MSSDVFADEIVKKIRDGALFNDLAKIVSNCAITKESGGEVGWVDFEGAKDSEHHLELVLPAAARQELVPKDLDDLDSKKTGDIFKVSSNRGVHVVQVVDVDVDLKRKIKLRKRAERNPWMTAHDKRDVDSKQLYYEMETMGCQMNIADSERIAGQLQSMNIMPIDKNKAGGAQPDVVVLNTCSIRDHAEQKVYSHIGPHAKRKRKGEGEFCVSCLLLASLPLVHPHPLTPFFLSPAVSIVIAGCVAEQEGEELLRRCPEVDLVMGPQYANRIADLLEDVNNGSQVVATAPEFIVEDYTKPKRDSTSCAWVNVIYGCNERCRFCIVPSTRGIEQSRTLESILEECRELVADGYKEITLLGQNIDSYGRDLLPKRKFSELLTLVGEIEGLQRLRFVTSHPKYMSEEVVDAVAANPSICNSFHIPFQSGDDKVLKDMGRGHSVAKYLKIIDRIRDKIPDAAITADVIVGFPGETEDEFMNTLKLMETVKFDSVNTAAYSPRPNTPAAEWTNQVDEDVKKDRLQRINRLNLVHAAERRKRMVGRTLSVLVEGRNLKKINEVWGRTEHGYIVYFEADIDEYKDEIVEVKITEASTYSLTAVMV